MTTVVNFSTNSTGGATKKRKRMPGCNHDMKPEIKQVNWFYADDETNANRIGFSAKTFHSSSIAANGTEPLFWRFYKLPMPVWTPNPAGRIGVSCQYLYARFKGYVHVTASCNQVIRWRLVLYRFDDVALSDDQQAFFNTLYANAQSITATAANASYINWQHNYYKKVWNVSANNWASKKVIASGIIPSVSKIQRGFSVQSGSSTGVNDFLFYDNNQEPFGKMNIPVDCKVKLYDKVDPTVTYAIMFESDCPVGWSYSTTTTINNSSSSAYTPFSISIFSRLYYTDI